MYRKTICLISIVLGFLLTAGNSISAETADINVFKGLKSFSYRNLGIDGIQLPDNADELLIYHVISRTGSSMFIGKPIDIDYYTLSDNIKVKGRFVGPIESDKLRDASGIVVATKSKKPFKEIKTKKINIAKSEVMNYLKKLNIPENLFPNNVTYKIISAGFTSKKTRLLILAWEDFRGDKQKRIVSIADIINGECTEVYTYLKGPTNNDQYLELEGMVDLDADFIADVFLIYYGDFGGKELFIQKGTEWHKKTYPYISPALL